MPVVLRAFRLRALLVTLNAAGSFAALTDMKAQADVQKEVTVLKELFQSQLEQRVVWEAEGRRLADSLPALTSVRACDAAQC